MSNVLELDLDGPPVSPDVFTENDRVQRGETRDGYLFEVFHLAGSRWAFIVTDQIDGLPIAAGVRDCYAAACAGANKAINLDRRECLPV